MDLGSFSYAFTNIDKLSVSALDLMDAGGLHCSGRLVRINEVDRCEVEGSEDNGDL